MSIPVGYIVTGVVITVAAIFALFTSMSKEEPQKVKSDGRRDRGTGSQSPRNYTPPPSPPSPSKGRGRRRKLLDRCANCDKSPYVKIHPCNHESLCKGCAVHYLKDNDTCRYLQW
ncbi:hypothetical protein HNY73_017360 [Argiope bruennichi]|uniref:Uncharacterized protein n=1 Tax=Argiope bruennichi TaxID=94029 RepID=A0A8T0ELI2_ARGBR|nr:hypothetical protein HNY73_017360 [Argiope bruennichi]